MVWQTAKNTFSPSAAIHKLFIEALLRWVLSTVTVLPQSENPLSTSELPCAKVSAALTTERMVGYFVWPIPSFINSTLLNSNQLWEAYHHLTGATSLLCPQDYWFHSSVSLSTFIDIVVNFLPSIQIPPRDESEVCESGCKTLQHRNMIFSRRYFFKNFFMFWGKYIKSTFTFFTKSKISIM